MTLSGRLRTTLGALATRARNAGCLMASVSGLTSSGVTGAPRVQAPKLTSGRFTPSMSPRRSAGWGYGRGNRDRRWARHGGLSSPRSWGAMVHQTQATLWVSGPPVSGTTFNISATRRAKFICIGGSSGASPTPSSCWRAAVNWWPRVPRTRNWRISKNSTGHPDTVRPEAYAGPWGSISRAAHIAG